MARGRQKRLAPARRLILLMPLAAWSVHQLRYLLAYGPGAGSELSQQGHAYMTALAPALVILAALGLGEVLVRLAGAWHGGVVARDPQRSLLRLWTIAAAGLAAIYLGQELLEGFLASGHPTGLAGVLGNGGWLALPVALMVGGLVALMLRGARAVESLLARRQTGVTRRNGAPSAPRIPSALAIPRLKPLAQHAAGRAPPALATRP